MEQSDRIKYVQNYLNNPLRKEYETKEKRDYEKQAYNVSYFNSNCFFPTFYDTWILHYLYFI